MGTQLRWIAAAVTTAVATMAMGPVSAQSYGNPEYSNGNGYGYGQSRLVRCESINSRRTYCRVDTRGGVRISRQLSGRSCVQGRNWSYSSRGIWVSNGCRAIFAISSRRGYRNDGDQRYGDNNDYRGNNDYRDDHDHDGQADHSHYVDSSGQLIHCQSTVDGRTYCGDHHSRYVMSGTRDPDCVEGQTWGRDDRGTWVSGNCDANFSIDQDYRDSGDYQQR